MSGNEQEGPGSDRLEDRLYLGLLHHPVLDKQGKVITTALTNLDLHDLARLTRTYDLPGCFIIQPLPLQRKLADKLVSYWIKGKGGEYNLTRKQAFERIKIVESLDRAVEEIKKETGEKPKLVGTSARVYPDSESYSSLREKMAGGGVWLLLFGTGWGIEPDFLRTRMDFLLEPVRGGSAYNHLSVRTAAAIIVDRLCPEPESRKRERTGRGG